MPNKNSPTKYSEKLKKLSLLFINPAKLMLTSRKSTASPLQLSLTGFGNTPQVQVDEDTVLTAQQIKALQRLNAKLEEENLILKKLLQSSRHTQAKTKSGPGPFQTASYLHPLPSFECESEYLLQVC